MSAWTRIPFDVPCGYCCKTIPRGTPVYELTAAKKKRCIACAKVPVPLDLPPLEDRRAVPDRRTIERRGLPEPVRQFAKLAGLAVDWKAKQSGDEDV